jgi:AraC family transcriptional activator of pyochelin receptor
MEVSISSSAGDDIQFVSDLTPRLQPYCLRGASPIVTTAGFGDMSFQHVAGKGFDLWYSTYAITTPATLTGRADIPVLELHIPFKNRMLTRWDGIGDLAMDERQFDLSFTPYVFTEVNFTRIGEYHTFDVHYHKELLQSFAPHFPMLDRFLERVERGEPANLLETQQFLSPAMIRVISEMLHYDFIDAVAPAFYESKCLELLIYMLQAVSAIRPATQFFATDLERAQRASELILGDLGRQWTAEELARATGTNIYTLKSAFKHLFGCSLFRFGEKARMDYARQLLLEGKLNASEIALRVGYPDVQNFSIAFKRVYKLNPRELKGRKP